MNKDIHKNLGKKIRVSSHDQALSMVRRKWNGAYSEGSMGEERSFWINGPDGNFKQKEMVGHYWPIRGHRGYWLRIKEKP
ncbi:MAG: hypothetical protein WC284_09645 [Candidimonas sp.]